MPEDFEQWAIVELFGHSRIAGRVTNQDVGGLSFVRVDVPAVYGCPAYTKLYGGKAIYSITFTDQATATAAAKNFYEIPVDKFTIHQMIELNDVEPGAVVDASFDPDNP